MMYVFVSLFVRYFCRILISLNCARLFLGEDNRMHGFSLAG
jgi:hypothetical protein